MINKVAQSYNLFLCFLLFSCKESESVIPQTDFESFPVKATSEIKVDDFIPASECANCHPNHFDEWSHSRHAFAMNDPLFFSGWNDEQDRHPGTGERFCIQCHSPVSFVTGIYLDDVNIFEDMENLQIPKVIQEGIGCDFCHSVTRSSTTVMTPQNLAAVAEYNLYPGEGVKYGPIESPQENDFHTSEYNSLFQSSHSCLPCHNMTVNGIDAEMTFTEWEDATEFSMGGIHSCQECHMPSTIREAAINGPLRNVHSHSFVGVDLDLSGPAENSPQYAAVKDLLQDAVTLEFDTLIDSVHIGDVLSIPVIVTNKTGHSMPSGVSFAREAWLEVIVKINDSILLHSGVLSSDTSSLVLTDNNLLLFTSYLISDTLTGKITDAVSETQGIINNSLKASAQISHVYEFQLSADQMPENNNGEIVIQLRMLFRPFKPHLLQDHPILLENLPIFEMARIDTTYIIP